MKLSVINKFSVNFNTVESVIKRYNISEIITTETIVKEWCKINKINCNLFLPNYLFNKEKAVYINDRFIISCGDSLLLFGENEQLITFAKNNNKIIINNFL